MLHLFNTLSGKKELFTPKNPPEVSLYVCGVTTYDVCHIGHARTAINFDILTRYLRSCDYQVQYVRNITDIDDKIIQRAVSDTCDCSKISEKYTQQMHADYQNLRILPPSQEPRATEYIQQIIAFIETLVEKDYAYKTDSGDVCFHVRKFKDYGALSQRNIDDLISGSRVEIDNTKQDALDFVLWKSSKENEPAWESPWGKGRPGWHIECSAMVRACLGENIDIHGGGSDLIFPHHENEIAQSVACTGQSLARYWLHSAPLTVDGQKMSKSLKNFVSIADVLAEYHPEEIRMFLCMGHYRSPLDWSQSLMQTACSALERLYIALNSIGPHSAFPESPQDTNADEKKFFESMDDDLNTPRALAALFGMANNLQKSKDPYVAGSLVRCGKILGILEENPEVFLRRKTSNSREFVAEVEKLITERNLARADKNWQRADEIRHQLDTMGVILEDLAQKTSWRSK